MRTQIKLPGRLRSAIGVAIGLQGLGCVPATFTVVPEVRGRVVSPAGDPLAGAKVRIAPADPESDIRAAAVTADDLGRFRRAEQTRWGMVLLVPVDAIAPKFVATASHANRESAPSTFGGGLTHPHHFGFTNKSESFDIGDLIVANTTR